MPVRSLGSSVLRWPSREEVEEIMTQLTVYGGFPRAVEGMRAARAAFAKPIGCAASRATRRRW